MALVSLWDHALAVLNVLYLIVGFVSVICNAFCVFAIVRGSILKKNQAFIMVAILCIADLFEGLAFIVTGIVRLLALFRSDIVYNQLECFFLNIPMLFSIPLTAGTMFLVAAERLYMSLYPLHYRIHGKQVIYAVIVADFMFFLTTTLCGFIDVRADRIPVTCVSQTAVHPLYFTLWSNVQRSTCVLLTIFAYTGVVYLFWKRSKKRFGISNTSSNCGSSMDAKAKAAQKAQTEVMKMAIAACTVFLISSLISMAFGLVAAALPPSSESAVAIQMAGLSTLLNAVWNVFIFPMKNAEMKRSMKQAFNVLSCGRTFAASMTDGQSVFQAEASGQQQQWASERRESVVEDRIKRQRDSLANLVVEDI